MTRPWSVGAAAGGRKLGHVVGRGRAGERRRASLILDDVFDDADTEGGETEKGTKAVKDLCFMFCSERAERTATLHTEGATTARWQLAQEYETMRCDAMSVCTELHRPLSPLLRRR